MIAPPRGATAPGEHHNEQEGIGAANKLSMMTLTDRLAGSLLGQALADALGFVVEAEPPDVQPARTSVTCSSRAARARSLIAHSHSANTAMTPSSLGSCC